MFPQVLGWSRAWVAVAAVLLVALIGYFGLRPILFPMEPSPEDNFVFLISDDVNAIGDFQSLNVSISRIGLQLEGESSRWIELDPEVGVIDLILLQEDKAQEIWRGNVPEGQYTKVFIYVTTVAGTLKNSDGNGEPADVKLPSNKLQISKPFTISSENGQVVDFVFDITVIEAGKSGKYNLLPQIAESGPDQDIDDVTPLEITTTILPDGVVGEEYEAEVEATEGIDPYTWSIVLDGDLPDGLELDLDDGKISGTPEAGSEGDYTFTVQVEDDSAQTDTQEFSIRIDA